MRIGIIGAGQLGRMLALAGYPLGFDFLFQDAGADAPGAQLADIILAPLGDIDAVRTLSAACDVITIDVENVSAEALAAAAAGKPLWPPVDALLAAQDRIAEKQLFDSLGIATPRYEAVNSQADLAHAVTRLGLPAVLKMRRLGYDGRGQAVLRSEADIDGSFERLGSRPAILEQFIPFDREVSQIGVRGADGSTAFYPLTLNTHRDGILQHSTAPYLDDALTGHARRHVAALMDRFTYRGILTVEFFVADGQLIANEIAPRVHNSGHWTIEGAVTSQFENHLRAITGLPLGSTAATGHSAMLNLIGELPPHAELLALQGLHLHVYGKAARPLRKLGHVTLVESSAQARDEKLAQLAGLIGKPQ